MLKRFSRYWWYLLLFGVIIMALGLLLLIDNQTNLIDMIRYLGYVMLGMGILTLLLNFYMHRKGGHADWRWYVVGTAVLVMGLVNLIENQWASETFVNVISFWAFLMGAYLLYSGLTKGSRSVPVILAGLVSIAFSALVLFDGVEESQLHLIVGAYAVLFGLYLAIMSFRMKGQKTNHSEVADSKDGGEIGSS
ncbi:MAG: DUF308 domain-containing protein [Flavobacteriia bacterium]|nr:DUF308 domain-containing protein [Flavobacteriia bacterium]